MLTSFFGKSSPVNFILLGVFICFFWSWKFFTSGISIEVLSTWGILVGVLLLLIFSMLLLDFILRKNQLTGGNTYGVFLFSTMICMLPLEQSLEYLCALGFILLSLRRIFSLSSSKNTEKKILDASLWILLASYFYFWSILAFFLLFISIVNAPQKKARYFAIPFVALIGLSLLATAYFLIIGQNSYWWNKLPEGISFQYGNYATSSMLLFLTVFFSVILWTGFYRVSKTKEVPKKNRPNYRMVFYTLLVFLAIVIIAPLKLGGEWAFAIVPASVIIAGFLEGNKEAWFKELLLWVFLLAPFVSLFL